MNRRQYNTEEAVYVPIDEEQERRARLLQMVLEQIGESSALDSRQPDVV